MVGVALPLCDRQLLLFIFSICSVCGSSSILPSIALFLCDIAMSEVGDEDSPQEEPQGQETANIIWHVITTCPLENECSAQSFKRSSCFGHTPDEARAKLSLHLQKSGNHKLDKDEADVHAACSEIVEEEWPENHGQEQQAQKKRRKTQQPPRNEPRPPCTPPPTHAAMRVLINQAVQNAVRPSNGGASSSSGAGAGGNPPNNALVRFQTQTRPFVHIPAEMISVPTIALQNAVDAIQRSIVSTEHARKMMANGAVCFEQERDVLNQSLELLQRQLQGS